MWVHSIHAAPMAYQAIPTIPTLYKMNTSLDYQAYITILYAQLTAYPPLGHMTEMWPTPPPQKTNNDEFVETWYLHVIAPTA